MDLPSKKVFDILLDKGVEKLYHANSVLTSCHFLRDGYLSSRGTVASYGVPQTSQSSDSADRKFSVWFDVFVDSVDIHKRASSRNHYGPVLFILDVKKLRKEHTGRIWVTRRNPIYWSGLSADERWFQNADDLKSTFDVNKFEEMIVFRHCGGRLPIKAALESVVLDDPKIGTSKTDFFSFAKGALRLAMTEGSFSVPIDRRDCGPSCGCADEYTKDVKRVAEMFSPFLV